MSSSFQSSDLISVDQASKLTGLPETKIIEYATRGRIRRLDSVGHRLRSPRTPFFVSKRELQKFLYLVEKDKKRYHRDGVEEELGFYDVPEWERTKHVHRLHLYLGKFIPQLAEYFLVRYFQKGEAVLDPFAGSGTTLIQANELGIHAVGIDISEFNCKIMEVKAARYDLPELKREIVPPKSTPVSARCAAGATMIFEVCS